MTLAADRLISAWQHRESNQAPSSKPSEDGSNKPFDDGRVASAAAAAMPELQAGAPRKKEAPPLQRRVERGGHIAPERLASIKGFIEIIGTLDEKKIAELKKGKEILREKSKQCGKHIVAQNNNTDLETLRKDCNSLEEALTEFQRIRPETLPEMSNGRFYISEELREIRQQKLKLPDQQQLLIEEMIKVLKAEADAIVALQSIREVITLKQLQQFKEDLQKFPRDPSYRNAVALQKLATALLSAIKSLNPDKIVKILGNENAKETLIKVLQKAHTDANRHMENAREFVTGNLESILENPGSNDMDLTDIENLSDRVKDLYNQLDEIIKVHQEELSNHPESPLSKELLACREKCEVLKFSFNGLKQIKSNEQTEATASGFLASLAALKDAILRLISRLSQPRGEPKNEGPRPEQAPGLAIAAPKAAKNEAAIVVQEVVNIQEIDTLIDNCRLYLQLDVQPCLARHRESREMVLAQYMKNVQLNLASPLKDIQDCYASLLNWYEDNKENHPNDERVERAREVIKLLSHPLKEFEKMFGAAAVE